MGKKAGGRGAQAAPCKAHLQEGSALQQRAERAKDPVAAARSFSAAVDEYRRGLELSETNDDRVEAALGLGESLQKWAEVHLQAVRSAPLNPAIRQQEVEAKQFSIALCQQSLQAYELAKEDDGSFVQDALANSGNVLSFWAELCAAPAEQAQLFDRACQAYEAAGAREAVGAPAPVDGGEAAEQDVDLLSNWADALIRRAECAAAAGDAAGAEALFARALGAYQAACQNADASSGDDGLLHNWGCGLQSRAEALLPSDPAAALAALEGAAGKLRSASEFAPEDAAPLNALGDVLQAAAERCAAAGDAGGARSLLEQASEHGYMRALRFDRGNADAQVGVGEVSLALCRAAAAAGDAAGAAEHAGRALGAYRAALQKPGELGSVAERLEVAYNSACAAAQAGAVEEALGTLRAVVAAGGATAQECCEDADLAPLLSAAGGVQGFASALLAAG